MSMKYLSVIAVTHLAVLASTRSIPASEPNVERWGVFEATFQGRREPQSAVTSPFSATFTQAGQHITVAGFWDGGTTCRLRFSPPTVGRWEFETASAQPELNGRTGSFNAVAPSGNNHGPIEVIKTFYLRYADGTPYHEFGTTCYAWVHQPDAMEEQTLKTLAASPFNKIRFCVFPKSYAYNTNEPEFFAFRKQTNGGFDFSQPDPAFWHHFEKRILDLQKRGIQADLILWHPYDRWGFANMSDVQDDAYLRYCITRLAAFRNVWWSLANEYDFMTDRPKGKPGNKQMSDWDRFFSILDKEDPFHRMRGIHNGRIWYDHTKPWVTHASLQSSDMNGAIRYRTQYQKPVIYDECKYEGNIPQGWGNLTAREMTQRFWLGTMSGCYVGHGETYLHPKDVLWWSKGGVLHGQSPARIAWLKTFMKNAPPFDELTPMGNDQGRFVLGKKGEYYLLYCLAGQTQTITLADAGPYKVDGIDPWEMTEWPIGTVKEGSFTASASANDLVYRFTPYAPGEPLRPEAAPTASVTAGVPPLTIQFDARTTHRVVWDFNDGGRSTQSTPTHTFTQPGQYSVTMTVTDDRGGSARGRIIILVDRVSHAPIVHVGFPDRNWPKLAMHGSVKAASNGGWSFSKHEPWGRLETDEALEDLDALRSFTISGWLRPSDLKVGSGGNRILFCLQRNTAGIDLVHLADGRMRLAVNEWPDRVSNDSSPGRLVAGKWTFFAVTYNALKPRDNVAWYFSQPIERPDPNTAITLDRKNTYAAGPVAEKTGPLSIGNFNRMMSGYGWDRQFRGEIKNLQVVGSRISGRAALWPTLE